MVHMRRSILLLTHGGWGSHMVKATEMIVGKVTCVSEIPLEAHMTLQEYQQRVEDFFKEKEVSEYLIIVDMFGGTPCNVAALFSRNKDIDVVCGLNSPLLIEAVSQAETPEGIDVNTLIENTALSIFDLKQRLKKKEER